MTNRFIAPKPLTIDPALIESPPAGEIQGLVERLREPLTVHLSVTGMEMGTAQAVRRMMVERAEAAEAITRLSQPSGEEIREAAGTRIWFDTEFIEDGKTIELVSIGMVRDDGATYYAEVFGADLDRADDVRGPQWPYPHAPLW